MGQETKTRVTTDTWKQRFRWLILGSLALHLVLTPAAVWLGIAGWWLTQDAPEAPPPEELDAIPVELLDEPAPLAEEPRDGLPEEDPVEIIEELVEIPRAQAPQPATSAEARPELEEAARRARAEAAAERQRAEEEARQRADAEAERKRAEEEARRRAALERSNAGDAGVAAKDAGARSRPVAKPAPQRRAIDNPVALVGKAGDVAKSNANLQLILYADRIREHPVGRRIGKLLPRLPQWNDFFGDGQLNPVEDFDQLFAAGPSFYYSEHLFVALAYNAEREQIRRAIDRLVRRRGRWLPDSPVPAALATADRAERLFVMPTDGKVVYVAPPKLRKQALGLGGKSLPRPQGDEAMVALIKNPKKSLWQLGLDIPTTTRDLRIRLTPLPEGAVQLELTAHEDSEEAAQSTARRVQTDLDAKWAALTGVSNILGRFGFGGLTRGMQLPQVRLTTKGSEIRGELVLRSEHVDFILDRVDRHLAYLEVNSSPKAPNLAPPTAKPAPSPPPTSRNQPVPATGR